MSIGTPYIAGTKVQASGTASITATLSHSVAVGDLIAVWVTTNTSTNNIDQSTGVTDTQGNVYTHQTPQVGTSLNGQWWICPNASALVAGTDTISLNCTGTGGTKTIQAIGCSGIKTSSPLDQSNGATGNSTTPSTVTGTTTGIPELILAGELNPNTGGAIAWTGDYASPLISDSQHTGSAQFSGVAAKILMAQQAVTASGTITSANWAISEVTFLPAASSTPPGRCRVGTTVPNLALGNTCTTNPGETPYDSGLSQDQGDNRFIAAVNRSLAGHLAVTKKFWTNVNDYRLDPFNNLKKYASYGTKVLFALTPPLSGGTAADQALLANFLTAIKGYGFNPSNCSIILWQEPEGGSHFGKAGFAQYATQLAFFGPTVIASGLPLCQDIGMGAGETVAQSFVNAGYGTGLTFGGQYHDYYYGPYSRGVRLDSVAAIANAQNPPVPVGLGEWGDRNIPPTPDDDTGYTNTIITFFQGRAAAGLVNLDVCRYEGQCSTLGTGDLTSPILTAADPRVPQYQKMFDLLTTLPSHNTITVTNPGNKTNNINDTVSLQIAATDSDPSQTLTFTATGLPAGLAISNTGLITGSPTTQQVSNVTVTATDTTGSSGSTGFVWTINPVVTNTITVASPGNQSTQLGTVVSLTLTATDSNAGITTFTWGASGLPVGLTIAPGPAAGGVITGAPSLIGTYSVTVTATDNTGSSGNITFTWVITSPQTLPAGQFTTIVPANQSPIGGLGICPQQSYEICLGLVAGSGSTIPFSGVTLSFYDFDESAGVQNFVDQVTFRCPMGTTSDPNGPAVITGRGPLRGAFMRVQIHNVDTKDATLAFLQIVGVSRQVDRDDWRWDCGGNAPIIPTYTNATAAASSLILGGVSGLSVPAGQVFSRLCSMYAGRAFARCHLHTGGPTGIIFSVIPQPTSLFASQAVIDENVNAGNADSFAQEIALPRGPCTLVFDNSAGASAAVIDAELLVMEE